MASSTRTGCNGQPVTDPPAIRPARPLPVALQGRKASSAIRAQPAARDPQARRDRKGRKDKGDAGPMGDPGATKPAGTAPHARHELTRLQSDELTIPNGATNAATASRPEGRSRRAAGRSARPGRADRAVV
jgi:hypothetical protein